MITRIFKTKTEELKKDVPASWYDLSLIQFVKIQTLKEDDKEYLPKFLEIMTGIEKAKWLTESTIQAQMAFNMFHWFETEPMPLSMQSMIEVGNKIQEINKDDKKTIVEKNNEINAILEDYKQYVPKQLIINEKPVRVKDDIENVALAATLDIENAIKTNMGEGIELWPGILACLFQESYSGGSYGSDEAMKLIPEMEKQPAHLVAPMVYFFLESLKQKQRFGMSVLTHSALKQNRRAKRASKRSRRG